MIDWTPWREPILARYGFGAVYPPAGGGNTWGLDPIILSNPAAWSDWFVSNSAGRTRRWMQLQVAGQTAGNTYGIARWELPHLAPMLARWRSVGPGLAAQGIQLIDYGGTRKPRASGGTGAAFLSATDMATGPEIGSIAIDGAIDAAFYAQRCLLPFASTFGQWTAFAADAMNDSYAGPTAPPADRATPENDTLDYVLYELRQSGVSAWWTLPSEAPSRWYKTGMSLGTSGAAPPIMALIERRPWIHIHGNSHDPLQEDLYDRNTTEVHVLIDARANALVPGQADWWMIDATQTIAVLERYVDQGQLVGIGGNLPATATGAAVRAWWDTYASSMLAQGTRRKTFLFERR